MGTEVLHSQLVLIFCGMTAISEFVEVGKSVNCYWIA